MKKRIFTLLLTVCMLLASTPLMLACGSSPSMDSIRAKFKDEGYEIYESTTTINSMDKIIVDMFFAKKETDNGLITVTVYKFVSKKIAKENIKDFGDKYEQSLKKGVYFCAIFKDSYKSAEIQAAIDVFDSCFK